jgi:hypothetical protein
MPAKSRTSRVAVGFRVKSGWATAVLLGLAAAPYVLDRRVVELSDPAVPASRQPYHASFGTLEEDASEIRWRTGVVRRAAGKSVAALLQAYRAMGYAPRSAALVVGSLIDPATVANPHIRAHALEGRLFRTVLEEALQSAKLACAAVLEKDAYAKAAAALGRTENDVKRIASTLGRALGGPWRADEKLAAAAAWMRLA